jgi:hypothetical protein
MQDNDEQVETRVYLLLTCSPVHLCMEISLKSVKVETGDRFRLLFYFLIGITQYQ